MSTSSERELFWLLEYLEDEFRGLEDVRVWLKQRTIPQRALDLEQDYDSEANTLHVSRGVMVRARGRDYFFPVDWALGSENRAQVDAQVQEIREFVQDRS
ncbi:hypothetical protein K2X30_15510 [bacterium]|jgi:hypothetical protein|nr:hypothetical protein [bacterium]